MDLRKGLRYVLMGALITASTAFMSFDYASAGEHGHGAPHWSYEGEGGPDHWGKMSADFKACSEGKNQSPIDIANAEGAKLPEISFGYKPSRINVLNNGHTIQVNYDEGSSINLGGVEYKLLQFHLHDPSEHTVGGKSFPMELHLVHKNAKNELAVVGVIIEKGKENAALKDVWANMPKKANEKKELKNTVDAAALLPAGRSYYTYPGSLTTPPCSESVTWLVLKEPVQMSEAQIKKFKDVIKRNNRPVQPINARKVRSAS